MPKIKNVFFIDFDDTLFNTKKFKKELIGIFKKNGVSEDQFKEFYYAGGGNKTAFSFERQVGMLKKKYNISSRRLILDFNVFIGDISCFLFRDTKSFLQKIKNKNNYLILLSYGDVKFQKKKILNSGIADFFDEIIITEGVKIAIIEKHKQANSSERVIFIEDHPKQLDAVMKKFSKDKKNKLFKKIDVIKIARKSGRYSNVKTEFPFERFENFSDIIKKVC